ncbi:MAG: DUF3800 domain-containing protein [Candidatus Helarchaeota archaeon]
MSETDSIICYCDNSELKAIWGAQVPDILIVGGFLIPRNQILNLIHNAEEIKKSYFTDPYIPIKWNLKSLQTDIEKRGGKNLFKKVLNYSRQVRADLLNILKAENTTFFISIIHAYSNKRQVLGETKQDLIGFAFGNLLMRIGSFVKKQNSSIHTEVILDWPERNDRSPFLKEYRSGWERGISGDVEYYCGPLCNIKFEQGPYFACMKLNVGLQMADLIVGATREFVDFSMSKRSENSFGVQEFFGFLEKFWASEEGKIVGHGISISPKNCELAKMIKNVIDK